MSGIKRPVREWADKYPGDPEALRDALIVELQQAEQTIATMRALAIAVVASSHKIQDDQHDMPFDVVLVSEEAVKALHAALALGQPNEAKGAWQTIESAPKDGTAILITRPTEFRSEEGWHVVRWDDDWWQCHDGKNDSPLRGDEPTHWQPLPSPPKPDSEKDS